MRRSGLRTAVVVLITVLFSGCRGDDSTNDAPATPDARPEITAAALRNGTYASQYVDEGSVRLADGMFEDTARRVTVFFQPEYAVGDLNGDGSPDAAVVLSTNSGGTGTFQDLFVVLNQANGARSESSIFLGDRVPAHRIWIEDAEIKLDLTMHGPADPMCCPTHEVTRRFELRNDALVELEPPPGAPDYTP